MNKKDKKNNIGMKIAYIHRNRCSKILEILNPYNIGHAQIPVLHFLHHNNVVCQEKIAQELKLNKGTVARSIKRLEMAGFVERKSSTKDKRIKTVHLTPFARKNRNEIQKISQKYTDKLLVGFDDKERELLNAFLDRMVKNMEGK